MKHTPTLKFLCLKALPRARGRGGFAFSCLLALSTSTYAQDLTIKSPPQSQQIVITGATLHPVSAAVIPSGYIVLDHGTITALGAGEPTGGVTTDARRINAKGQHIYPGLIGAYTQIGLSEIQSVRATEDQREVGQITPEAQALVSINPDSTLIPVTRATGVLSVGVFPTGGVVGGQPCVVSLEGWTWEEMTVRRSLGVTVRWPFPRPITAWWNKQPKDEQYKQIKKSIDLIDGTFRIAKSYAETRSLPDASPPDVRWDAMRPLFTLPSAPDNLSVQSPAQPGGTGVAVASTPNYFPLPTHVFITANDVEQIEQCVTWAIDLGVKPVIVGGRDAPLCAEFLKRHHVPVILQGVNNLPKRADADYDEPYTIPAKLESLGVTWCLASGEETAHERSLPHHAGRAMAFGLSEDAAVRSITLSAAEILGVADKLGSLDVGKAATIIITDASPLEVTTKVTRAFINGREIDLSSKQSKLAEKYREKYRQQKSAH